jgi:hypothetical protein
LDGGFTFYFETSAEFDFFNQENVSLISEFVYSGHPFTS